MSEDPKLYGVIANAVASWRATEKIKFSAPQSKLLCDHLYKKIADKQDNIGIAEALGNFAQKTSRQTALHWYVGFDDKGKVAMFPEEIGLPLHQAVATTIETIKKAVRQESGNDLIATPPTIDTLRPSDAPTISTTKDSEEL